MTLLPQRVDEADSRRVEVEEADSRARRPEAVFDVRRHRDERTRAGRMPFAPEVELDVALEHVERVRVVRVGVRVDALEVGREVEVERLDVLQLTEYAVSPELLTLAGTREERL